MRVLCLILALTSLSAMATDPVWLSQNCPRCFQTSDKNFLFKVNDQIVKFSPRKYGKEENLKSDFIEIEWVGISDTKGETISKSATFSGTGERERFLSKFKRVCSLFSGYEYFDSEYQSDSDLPIKGQVKMTCFKTLTQAEASKRAVARSKPQVEESVTSLVNFLNGSDSKKQNLGIYDESRGEEARNPRGGQRLPASTGAIGK